MEKEPYKLQSILKKRKKNIIQKYEIVIIMDSMNII